MRQLLTSMISGGGALACICFFLPWVALSCQGTALGTISPHDRAVGMESDVHASTENETETLSQPLPLETEPAYWLLLLLPATLTVIGVLPTLLRAQHQRQIATAAGLLALIGLLTTTQIGIGQNLGIRWSPNPSFQITHEAGVWISLASYSLAMAGAILTGIFGPSLEDNSE